MAAADWSTEEIIYASYCPENVVFVVDLDPEILAPLNGTSGLSRLDALKEALKSFVHIKTRLNPMHKVGIVTLRDSPEWRCRLTGDVGRLCGAVNGLAAGERPYERFNLGCLCGLLDRGALEDEWHRGVMTRFVLVYSRSGVVPDLALPEDASTALRMDLLYLHDKPSEGCNQPQRVYDELIRHTDEWAFALEYNSYIFEAPASNSAPAKVRKYMAWLLSHPLQRCHQEQMPRPTDISRLPVVDGMARLPQAI